MASLLGKNRSSRIVLPKINLVPHDPFFDTVFGAALVWGTQVGRYLIIITEFIVFVSFASRFVLDRQLTDLTTSITQKQAIIHSYGDTETEVRSLQKQIQQTASLLKQGDSVTVLQAVLIHIPNGVTLSSASYTPDQVIISGRAPSSDSVATMITAFQLDPTFKGLSIDKISSETVNDPGVDFAFRLSLVNTAVPKTSTTTKPNTTTDTTDTTL